MKADNYYLKIIVDIYTCLINKKIKTIDILLYYILSSKMFYN